MRITVTTTRRAATAALLVTATLALTSGCHDGRGSRADGPATAVSPAPDLPSTNDGGDPPPARTARRSAPPRCSGSRPGRCRGGRTACC